MEESVFRLRKYVELLNDRDCLKIIYYLYRFNPHIPIKELSQNLDILEVQVISCLDKLINSDIVVKTNEQGYSLTMFGRQEFKKLLTVPKN